MIPGVDTHGGYGRINWKLVAEAGIRFAWNKSAEGNDPAKDDHTWARNCAEASANGIASGVYFFPYPLPHGAGKPAGRHPVEQAERFHRRVGGLGSRPGELAPVIDAEWPPRADRTQFVDLNGNGVLDPGEPLIDQWAKWGCSAGQISDWLREHCAAVEQLFGRLPVIYTYPWWWAELAKGADVSWAARYPLWMAAYTHPGPGIPGEGKRPPVPAPWKDWAAWQYSAEGSLERVSGIPACPIDRDVLKDEDTLLRLTGQGVPDTEPAGREPEPFAIVHSLSLRGLPGVKDDDPDPAA